MPKILDAQEACDRLHQLILDIPDTEHKEHIDDLLHNLMIPMKLCIRWSREEGWQPRKL
jgi:hypothetical protein